MSLATVLTVDPVEALAQDLADDCARLAQKSVAVYTRDEALKSMRELKPILAVIGCGSWRRSAWSIFFEI